MHPAWRGCRASLRWLHERFLNIVPEPRYESVIFTIIYAVFAFTGFVTLLVPPQTIAGELGAGAMGLTGWFFLVGALVAMLAGQRGWWELERWAVSLILAALITYGSIITSLHFQAPGSRLTQLGIVAVAVLTLVLRLGGIWRYPFKPRR